MKYKYQLILLGENEQFFKELKINLANKFDELKLNIGLLKFITMDNIGDYSGGEPAYVIYAGNKNNLDLETNEVLENQKLDGNIILPVFLNDFSSEIPEVLSNQNGLKYDNNLNKISNLILRSEEHTSEL